MEYPWFKEYRTCGIPTTLEPYPDVPTHYFIDDAAERYPRAGCVQLGLEISYGEIKGHADRLSNSLASMQISKGDRVATLLPTSVQFILADTAISKAGAVHVPCSFLEPKEHLARKFAESTPKALICLDEHLHVAEYLRDYMDSLIVIQTNLHDFSAKLPGKKSSSFALQLLEVIEQAGPQAPDIRFNPSRDLETLLFTGGTTGVARGCMLTHRNVVANATQTLVIFGPMRDLFQGNISVVMGNPFFHAYGHAMFHNMLSMAFNMLLPVDPRDKKALLEMLKEYRPILMFGVPTQFMEMLGEDMKKVKVVGLSGSAPLRPKVQEQFEEQERGIVMEGYGLSEMTAATHFNLSALIRLMGGPRVLGFLNRTVLGNVGLPILRGLARIQGPKLFGRIFMTVVSVFSAATRRLANVKSIERVATIGVPLPDTEVRVLSLDTGGPLSLEELSREGKTGELLIRGPQTMLGYWPEEGKGLDKEGFVHTGDVVKMDESGYFAIVDRTKDMVIVSGFKVYTREVDDILHEHPATDLAATIGVPDPARPGSECVMVFVKVKHEYRGDVTEDEYLEFLRGKVARYAVPRSVTFLDEMPVTEVFKIRKNELRRMALEQLGAEAGPGVEE
jgi:acyl-CoA synthetase (AMP-forming)/AMP-acid ligase II